MIRKTSKQTYVVDLTETERSGVFPCPSCGSVIDPGNTATYRLNEEGTKTRNSAVEEMAVNCVECGSPIRLGGFLKTPQKYQEETV